MINKLTDLYVKIKEVLAKKVIDLASTRLNLMEVIETIKNHAKNNNDDNNNKFKMEKKRKLIKKQEEKIHSLDLLCQKSLSDVKDLQKENDEIKKTNKKLLSKVEHLEKQNDKYKRKNQKLLSKAKEMIEIEGSVKR